MFMKKLLAGAAISVIALSLGTTLHEAKAETTTTTVIESYTMGPYVDWDVNNDGWVDRNELATTSYTKIDLNGDGIIDGTEWSSYTTYTIKPEAEDDSYVLSRYDRDGNGNINETEYQAYLDDQKIYESWDVDSDTRISAREYETVTKKYETRPDGSHVTTTTTVTGKSTVGDVDADTDADVYIKVD